MSLSLVPTEEEEAPVIGVVSFVVHGSAAEGPLRKVHQWVSPIHIWAHQDACFPAAVDPMDAMRME